MREGNRICREVNRIKHCVPLWPHKLVLHKLDHQRRKLGLTGPKEHHHLLVRCFIKLAIINRRHLKIKTGLMFSVWSLSVVLKHSILLSAWRRQEAIVTEHTGLRVQLWVITVRTTLYNVTIMPLQGFIAGRLHSACWDLTVSKWLQPEVTIDWFQFYWRLLLRLQGKVQTGRQTCFIHRHNTAAGSHTPKASSVRTLITWYKLTIR